MALHTGRQNAIMDTSFLAWFKSTSSWINMCQVVLARRLRRAERQKPPHFPVAGDRANCFPRELP